MLLEYNIKFHAYLYDIFSFLTNAAPMTQATYKKFVRLFCKAWHFLKKKCECTIVCYGLQVYTVYEDVISDDLDPCA